MKTLVRVLALLLALLMLCGCTDLESNEDSMEERSTRGTDTSDESGEPAGEVRTVRVLTSITAVDGDEASSAAVSFSKEGITLTEEYGDYTRIEILDLQGREIMVQESGEDGSLYISEKHAYDDRGNCTELCYFGEDGSKGSHHVYEYNELNQKIRAGNVWSSGRVSFDTEYEYYENGKLKTRTSYDIVSGELTMTMAYIQDGQGRTVRCNVDDQWLDGYYTYSYDEQGRMICAVWTDDNPSGEFYSEYFTYDEAGRVIHYLEKAESSAYSTEYIYDEQGYLISVVYFDGATVTYHYQEIELPGEVADAAQSWSKDGVIAKYCVSPDPNL